MICSFYELGNKAHDPFIHNWNHSILPKITPVSVAQNLIDSVDILLIATPHSIYEGSNFSKYILNESAIDPLGYLKRIEKNRKRSNYTWLDTSLKENFNTEIA